jgi:hypothetical protein
MAYGLWLEARGLVHQRTRVANAGEDGLTAYGRFGRARA